LVGVFEFTALMLAAMLANNEIIAGKWEIGLVLVGLIKWNPLKESKNKFCPNFVLIISSDIFYPLPFFHFPNFPISNV